MATPGLNFPQLSAGQADKTTTVNDALLAIEEHLVDVLLKDVSAGGAIALTDDEATRHKLMNFTGAPGGEVTVEIPAGRETLVFARDSTIGGNQINLGVAGGASVGLTAGEWTIVHSDGVNAILISVGGAGSGGGAAAPSAERIELSLSADQVDPVAPTLVAFDQAAEADGLSLAANKVALKAGKTYLLMAHVRISENSGAATADFVWRDDTAGADIGETVQIKTTNDAGNTSSGAAVLALFTPASDSDVGLRIAATSAGTVDVLSAGTVATVVQVGQVGGGGFVLRQQLGAPAASMSVSGVPGDADVLRIQIRARTDAVSDVSDLGVRFNGDASASYSAIRVIINGSGAVSAAGSGSGQNQLEAGPVSAANAPAQAFGVVEGAVPRYDASGDSIHKAANFNGHLQGTSSQAGTRVTLGGGRWENDAAITSIEVLPLDGSNFVAGSEIIVYGLRLGEVASGEGAFESALLHVVDEKAAGTAGGGSSTGVNTRDLNAVLTNEIAGASLGANQINLPAGTYWAEFSAPAHRSDAHQARLRDVTNLSTLAVGSSEFSSNAAGQNDQTRSGGAGRFVLAGAADVELQHDVQMAQATDGLGVARNGAEAERYAEVRIWKVA